MHQLVMYDAFFSKSKRQDFGVFSLDDIDGAFAANRWVLLNYSQQYTLPPLPGASASTADVALLPPVLTARVRNGHAAVAGYGTGKPGGITITPFPAGHLIGGAVWVISRETDVVVYAVQFNHSKEK